MLSCSIAQISGQSYKMLLLSMAYFMTLSATQITLSTNLGRGVKDGWESHERSNSGLI